jgi:hypothetical protein
VRSLTILELVSIPMCYTDVNHGVCCLHTFYLCCQVWSSAYTCSI